MSSSTPHKKCLVNQREVKVHTESFASALRAALREDPDVILVGEMRDLETISLAVSAAETGHLVFGTLHTSSAAQTVDRIIDVFPPHQQSQISDPAFGVAARGHRADAGPEDRRRPGSGFGDHDDDGGGQEPDPGRQDVPIAVYYRDRLQCRDADAGAGTARTRAQSKDHAGKRRREGAWTPRC